MDYDYLIVGAGFSGCVLAERIAVHLKKRCLIVEKRKHIGGNAFDYITGSNILVHKYGPHIFHTNSDKVYNYLSRFTEWFGYQHKVLANIDGINVPIPFNLNSLSKLFIAEKAIHLENLLVDNYGYDKDVSILDLLRTTHPDIKELADFIYSKIFYNYTKKQWGLEPSDLDPSVLSRVPGISINRDDRFFRDKYQGIPSNGYTALFKRLTSGKNLVGEKPYIVKLFNTDYKDIIDTVKFKKIIFTGSIDEFFDYKFGILPYRSLRLEHNTYNVTKYQEVAQINYPNNFDYTRRTESRYFAPKDKHRYSNYTICTTEYPEPYVIGENEPYYPIPQKQNRDLYNLYAKEAEKISDKVIFCGRLADYKYYNMDQVVAHALHIFENKICKEWI